MMMERRIRFSGVNKFLAISTAVFSMMTEKKDEKKKERKNYLK